ncbi:MAG: 2OG-Fe(II) oxygenase [Bacteroidota bacterium]
MAAHKDGQILFEIPKIDIQPHIVHNYLSKKNFKKLKTVALKKLETSPYDPLIARYTGSIEIPDEINEELLSKIRTICGRDDMLVAYNFLVKYQIKDQCVPHLWEHVDQNGSHVSVNMTIAKSTDWKLIVERQTFELEENSAVVFLGQEHDHARPGYPSNDPEDYVIQLFLEYATPDHWIIKEKDSDKKNGMAEFGRDGDIRFFNRHRYFPLPDPPGPNPPCMNTVGTDSYSRVLDYYTEIEKANRGINEIEKVSYAIDEPKQLFPGLYSYGVDTKSAEMLWGLTINSCYKQWTEARYGVHDPDIDDSMRFENFFLKEQHKTCHPVDPIARLSHAIFEIFDTVVELYSRNFSLRPLVPENYGENEKHKITLLRSGVGKSFNIHADEQPDRPRVVTALMYLNDSYTDRNNSYTGGEIVFNQLGIEIAPKAGQILVFPSNYLFSHMVKPVISGVRYAASRFYIYER